MIFNKLVFSRFIFIFLFFFTFFSYVQIVNAQELIAVTEYSINTQASSPQDIVIGDQNEIWFTEKDGNKIGKYIKDSGFIEYQIPTEDSGPTRIAKDVSGNIWFIQSNTSKVGKLYRQGVFTEFELGTNGVPNSITAGYDENIWLSYTENNIISRISPEGLISDYYFDQDDKRVFELTPGLDNNIWFLCTSVDNGNSCIGYITSNGSTAKFDLANNNITLNGLTKGPDGKMWFTGYDTNSYQGVLGTISSNGRIVEFAFDEDQIIPYKIISGPDNTLWFDIWAYDSVSMIGKATTDANIVIYKVPNNVIVNRITLSADNKIWFINNRHNKIGYFDPRATTNEILNVPYFSQNDEPWGSSEYDHAKFLGLKGALATMDRWGCAVTSVAMILRYHNINEMIDGSVIDPGTLNVWLKNNKGYSYGFGKDGWYSYLNWPSIGKLTNLLYNSGKSNIKLEHKRAYPSTASIKLLNDDLTVGNSFGPFPDILYVNNNGHFVVVKGLLDDTYAINDPEWGYETLNSFNNSYSQIDRFVPSQTNLSYITIVVNPDVEILVTDGYGRKTGKIIQDGQVLEYNEIPNATYAFSAPIENTDSSGDSQMLGTGVNEFLLPVPDDGGYEVALTGLESSFYSLNISTFQKDGANDLVEVYGSFTPGQSNNINIQYNQLDSSEIEKEITFDNLKIDLQVLYNYGQITNKGVYNSLIKKLDSAIGLKDKKDYEFVLRPFINELKAQRGKHITEQAYLVLMNDISALISN